MNINEINLRVKILLITTLLLFSSQCLAENTFPTIKEKKAIIVRIMNQGHFSLEVNDNKKFCEPFLKNFTNQQGIEHIKPVVTADYYEAPELHAYLKKCPKLTFNKDIRLERMDVVREFFATKNFMLYLIDIDNNKTNGDEYVLYAEGYKEGNEDYDYGAYKIIDLKNCQNDTSRGTARIVIKKPYDYLKNRPLEGGHGVIKYKEEYFIYELTEGGDWRKLVLYKNADKYNELEPLCRYLTKK